MFYGDEDINNIEDVKFIGSKKQFSFLIFIILLLCGFIPAFLYFVYYMTKDDDIFVYALKFKYDNVVIIREFHKNDLKLKYIRNVEARNFFNKN